MRPPNGKGFSSIGREPVAMIQWLNLIAVTFFLIGDTDDISLMKKTSPAHELTLFPLNRERIAACLLSDDIVLELLNLSEVHFNILCDEPIASLFVADFVLMRSGDQRFRRDTAAVQTDTADLPCLHKARSGPAEQRESQQRSRPDPRQRLTRRFH